MSIRKSKSDRSQRPVQVRIRRIPEKLPGGVPGDIPGEASEAMAHALGSLLVDIARRERAHLRRNRGGDSGVSELPGAGDGQED